MAKSKRKGRVGQVITIRRMNGLGRLTQPSSFAGAALPPLIGAGLTGLTVIAARYFAKPSEGETPKMLFKWAPGLGIGLGLVGSAALYWLGGAPAAVSSAVASVAVGGLAFAADQQLKANPGEFALALGPGATPNGTGVVVGERIGTRGIMFENPASRDPANRYGIGSYGETVNMRGITPSAFGRTHLGR